MVGVTLWLDTGGTVGLDTGGTVGFDTGGAVGSDTGGAVGFDIGTGSGGILLSSSNALLRSSCISSRSSLASLTHLAIRFALPNLASDNGVVSLFRRRRFGPPLLEVGLPFLTVLFSMARTVESTPSKTRLFITRCNMDRLRLLWSIGNLTRPTCYSRAATIPGATLREIPLADRTVYWTGDGDLVPLVQVSIRVTSYDHGLGLATQTGTSSEICIRKSCSCVEPLGRPQRHPPYRIGRAWTSVGYIS